MVGDKPVKSKACGGSIRKAQRWRADDKIYATAIAIMPPVTQVSDVTYLDK